MYTEKAGADALWTDCVCSGRFVRTESHVCSLHCFTSRCLATRHPLVGGCLVARSSFGDCGWNVSLSISSFVFLLTQFPHSLILLHHSRNTDVSFIITNDCYELSTRMMFSHFVKSVAAASLTQWKQQRQRANLLLGLKNGLLYSVHTYEV